LALCFVAVDAADRAQSFALIAAKGIHGELYEQLIPDIGSDIKFLLMDIGFCIIKFNIFSGDFHGDRLKTPSADSVNGSSDPACDQYGTCGGSDLKFILNFFIRCIRVIFRERPEFGSLSAFKKNGFFFNPADRKFDHDPAVLCLFSIDRGEDLHKSGTLFGSADGDPYILTASGLGEIAHHNGSFAEQFETAFSVTIRGGNEKEVGFRGDDPEVQGGKL
jgi:hypothetical protein